MSARPPRFYDFGPFRLDRAERRLLRGARPVQLTIKAFETLLALVENEGRVLGKDELIARVWPDAVVEEGSLNVNIYTLRRALGETQGGSKYIETVPRRGFRFVAQVRATSGEGKTGKNGRGAERTGSGNHRQAAAAPNSQQANGGGARRGRKVIDSLAVLPLVNAGRDAEMEYLSDGITESIINSLSQLPQLRVMARSTVFRYKGREIDPQLVGRELNVSAVLTGRVIQLNENLIIRTELVDVADGWQLWGEQYNRNSADLLAVQEEISREISEKLRLKLSGEQKRRLAKRYTESTEAYQTYLKGRFYWNKRTLEGLRRGVEYFQQAIRLDPDYALAYAGLADSYLLMGSVEYGALHPKEALQSAKIATLEALRLDGTLAEAHASLGYVRLFDWDWSEAEKEYRRAVELNPNYATAHHWYALYLTAMGRNAEAVAEIKRAQELDPLSLPIGVGVGWHFFLTRQYDRAIAEYHGALEMEPNFYMAHLWLGLAYAHKGLFAEALAEYERATALSGVGPLTLAAQAHTYALTGEDERARRLLDELQQLSEERYVSPYYIAAVHTALGERDEAFRWLDLACENRSEGMVWLKVDPTLDSLRSSTRFAALMRGVGLTPSGG
ncbi:MAG TPA: winged helix-turn-helix domain-containing protein [Pyrinomonadaceae bacterium]|nr:winged helix-turn-helix domain-containing protein [Pyrinomonadaceae bacterium]